MPTIVETIRKIAEIARTPAGWRYGQGKAASSVAISCARQLNVTALRLGYSQTNVFLAESGGVQFVVYEETIKGQVDYEFNIYPNGRIDFAFLLNGQYQEEQERDNLSLVSAITILEEYAQGLCHTSDSFTQKTTTQHVTVFEVLRSARLTMESPWLNQNVPQLRKVDYVPTSPIGTRPILPASHLCTG